MVYYDDGKILARNMRWISVILSFSAVLFFPHATACAKVETNGLNKSKLTVRAGRTKVLTMKGIKKKTLWKSSNKKVASVSAEGVVSGIARGTAVVTASYGKRCVKCKVTVIGKNDYSSVLTEKVIRKALSVPRQAKVKIKYGKKYYKRSFGATLVPVDVFENGKKAAGASFFVKDGELGCNVLNYGHYE